jgi:hypothetical protein
MHQENRWSEVGKGLRTIATAMAMQMAVAVLGLLLILYALNARDVEGLQTGALLIGVVGLVAQIVLVSGIFKFSKQPPPAPGAGPALVAGVLGILGVVVSAYVLFVLVQISSIGPTSSHEAMINARDAARSLPKVEVLAVVTGFVALLLLMAAVAAVARHIDRPELERKAHAAMGLAVASAGIYAFVKLGFEPREMSTAIVMLLMVAVVQISSFVMVLGAVRALADNLIANPPPDLPAARSL